MSKSEDFKQGYFYTMPLKAEVSKVHCNACGKLVATTQSFAFSVRSDSPEALNSLGPFAPGVYSFCWECLLYALSAQPYTPEVTPVEQTPYETPDKTPESTESGDNTI